MTARQGHGLMFEKLLNTMMESFVQSEGYTDKDDGFLDTLHGRVAVSAKNTSMKGEICLGDMERIVYSEEPLLMFNGRHLTGESMPETVFVHSLPFGFSGLLGGGWCRDEARKSVLEFKDYMTNPYNELRQEDEEEIREECGNDWIDYHSEEFNPIWRERLDGFKEDYFDIFGGQDNVIIHPRPKRNHNQSRLQCAMPYRFITEFAKDHLVMSLAYNGDGTMSIRDYLDARYGYYEDEDLEEMREDGEIDGYRHDWDKYGNYTEYDFYNDNVYGMSAEERAWYFLEETLCNFL